MSIGRRKAKTSRAQLRSLPSSTQKQSRLARQRARLLGLSVVTVSVVAVALIVHGSGPPLVYRLGEKPDREIRVKVREFKIRNQTKTSNERQAAADKVPPSMANDPAPIKDLADRLDDLTVTISKSERFEDVAEAARAAWNLQPETYLDIKAATDTQERRDNLHVQLQKAFQPLLENGVLGPDALPRNEEAATVLSIHNVGQPWSSARPVPRDRVVPERIVKPDGPVSRDFVAAFTTPRIGETLFHLVAHRIDGRPTLTYEPEITARLRDEARGHVSDYFDTYSKGDVLVEQAQTIGEE
ncbi:MAG: HD family phosphohydrolase, partial [Isosphaeraceae bacterium]